MSLIRIFFNPLDAKSLEEYPIEAGTQIIDWLVEHYPEGFDGFLRVFAGVDEIAAEDFDYVVKEDEQITMLVMPSGWEAVAAYAIQAVIAFAIGYVINLIFAPDVPGQPKAGEESVVYSLSPSRNQARLGEPVEVVYGRVSWPPSFAAVPYSFYTSDSNDQFVDEILCLGQGYFEIEDVIIGEANATLFQTGAVRIWQFGPDDHKSTMGVIENAIWNDVKDTDAPFPFYENVFTSPEVDNFEFQKTEDTTPQPAATFNGTAIAEIENNNGQTVPGRITNIDTTLLPQPAVDPFNQNYFNVGNQVTLSGTASNDITFTISSIVVDAANPDLITLYQSLSDTNKIADEDPLPGGTQYSIDNIIDDSVAGPYRCQKLGSTITEVICQFVFPRGLYHRDGTDGDIKDAGVSAELSVQEIDPNDGSPVGAPIVVSQEFRAKNTRTYRGQISSGPLTPGAYEVTVTRLGTYDDERTVEDLSLVGVQGVVELNTTVGETYGPVTLLCVRMKASNGLAEAARGRIRVTAKRILKEGQVVGDYTIADNGSNVWGAVDASDPAATPPFGVITGPLTKLSGTDDGSNTVVAGTTPRGYYGESPSLQVTIPAYSSEPISLTYVSNKEDYRIIDAAFTAWLVANDGLATTYSVFDPDIRSDNPMTAIKDIYTNSVYGLGRPVEELNIAHIDDIESSWNVDGFGPRCNGSFDQRDTGYHAMQVVASMTGSKIVNDGGLVDVVQEIKQDVRKALFSSANVIKDSLSINYNFDTQGEYTGIKLAYRDPSTFEELYAWEPAEELNDTPDTITLWGVTDSVYAQQMAKYFYNVKGNRRKLTAFQVELDGWLVKFGDRIGVSMQMPSWGDSGVVIGLISATQIRVDHDLNWLGGDVVLLRDDQGRPDGPYPVTQGATPDIITFATVPTTPLYDMEGREPSSYVFGQSEDMVMDFMVSKVTPQGETIFEIEAQTYTDQIYDGAPPHMGGVVGQGYSELVFQGTETWDGYHNTFGMIAATDAGQTLIINDRGHGHTRTSFDGGATWNDPVIVGTDGSGTGYPLNTLIRDESGGRWFANQYRQDTHRAYINVSSDNGATWTRVTDGWGSYCHGMLVTDDVLKTGGRSNTKAYLTENSPADEFTATAALTDAQWEAPTFGPNVTWTWNQILSPDWFAVTASPEAGGDGNGQTTVYIYQTGFGIVQEYVNTLNHTSETATRGQGEMLVFRDLTGSVLTYDNVKQNGGGVYITPWPTVTVDFGVDIEKSSICYASGPDIYLIAATDLTDNQMVHFRYCNGDDFSQWYSYPSIVSIQTTPVTEQKSTQLYWSNNNTYYWGYAQDYDSSEPLHVVYTRFNFDEVITKPPSVVINQTDYDLSFDAQIGDTFDPQGVATIGIISEYGTGGFESIPSTSSGYSEIIPEELPQLNHNTFTIEMSYYAKDFSVDSGMFAFGSSSDVNWQIRIMCQTDGTINATMYAGGLTFQLISSAGEPLLIGQWYKICLECDGYKARLYIDGVAVVTKTYHQTEVWASDTRCLMGWTQVSNRFHGVICNTRISNGWRYRGDYTPATAPFPVV